MRAYVRPAVLSGAEHMRYGERTSGRPANVGTGVLLVVPARPPKEMEWCMAEDGCLYGGLRAKEVVRGKAVGT